MKAVKRSVLCVDDNEDNLELLEIIFEDKGFEVKTCNSLHDCLPLIRENDLSAVVLDNRFSGETSLTVCREIRSLKPNVPIVFYSAEARAAEIEKALAAGADAYLTKPEGFNELTETVIRLIDEKAAV